MNDLIPPRHGDEGEGSTHIICRRRLELFGGNGRCCACYPHPDCNLNEPYEKAMGMGAKN